MAQKYKAQIYSTWPKYKAQIILNNLYRLEDFFLILYFLHMDFFMFVIGPEQLNKSLNRMRWAQSSGKLLILPLALCPLYSLINVAEAYSIKLAPKGGLNEV